MDLVYVAFVLGELDAPSALPVVTADEVEEEDACWLAATSEATAASIKAGDDVKGERGS